MNIYTGEITAMSEQGGGHWPQFHDYRGRHGDELQFWNWDWTINFGKGTKIKRLVIYNDKGELLYDDSWTFSKENTLKAPTYFPCPSEMDPNDWCSLLYCNDKLSCVVVTDELLEALKKDEALG